MVKEKPGVYAGSKIPYTLQKAMRQAVRAGNYLNSSDFVRDAIKEKLSREGYVWTSDMDTEKESMSTL
jgi:Arc/MetJ-type ribon-helix-helix transcriptional regulator